MRVYKLIRCPYYESDYHELRHSGHAAELSVLPTLSGYSFEYQKEIKYESIEAHIDFLRDGGDYIEFIEIKNTSNISYLHIFQVSMYKSILYHVFRKPVVAYLWYTRLKHIMGENVYRPQWAPSDVVYIYTIFDAGENYMNYARARLSLKMPVAGPYCVSCITPCRLRDAIKRKV